jgi:hypothetical protein
MGWDSVATFVAFTWSTTGAVPVVVGVVVARRVVEVATAAAVVCVVDDVVSLDALVVVRCRVVVERRVVRSLWSDPQAATSDNASAPASSRALID